MADFERDSRPGPDALEPPAASSLFRHQREPAGRARRVPVGGAQPAGDALADVAGGHRARRGRARAGFASSSACRTRSKASSTTRPRSRRCTRWRRPGRRRFPASGPKGSPGAGRAALRVYCSEQAHSSVDKAVITLGLGHARAAENRRRRRVPACAPIALERAIAEDRAGGVAADRRRRNRRHDVHDEHRSGARHRRDLRARATLAARRCRVRRRRGDAAVACARPRWRGASRLAGRQSAQVAVHAVRSQRVLLPADGSRARDVLADARLPPHARDAKRRT